MIEFVISESLVDEFIALAAQLSVYTFNKIYELISMGENKKFNCKLSKS